jgi:hypothetical protein
MNRNHGLTKYKKTSLCESKLDFKLHIKKNVDNHSRTCFFSTI